MRTATYFLQNDATDLRRQPSIHEGEGTIVRRMFFREQSQLPIRMDVWELPPGASEGSHAHALDDPLEEIYYVLSGRGELRVEGEVVALAPGDAALVPPGIDHGLVNTGQAPLRLLLIWGKPQPSAER